MRPLVLALVAALAGCGGVAGAETLFSDTPVCPGGDGLPDGWQCCGAFACGPGNACGFNNNFQAVCEMPPTPPPNACTGVVCPPGLVCGYDTNFKQICEPTH